MKPLVRGLLLGTLGSVLFHRRERLSELVRQRRRAAARPPAERGRTAGELPPDELERLTRAELYRRAQAAGIPGRSEMSKAELIAALRAAAE
jgi:hypothetical protein